MACKVRHAPICGTRRIQEAKRVADFLERAPGSSQKEIDAACNTGCISKVLSDMPCMGYGLARGWREVPCPGDKEPRRVRTYALLYRPECEPQQALF